MIPSTDRANVMRIDIGMTRIGMIWIDPTRIGMTGIDTTTTTAEAAWS